MKLMKRFCVATGFAVLFSFLTAFAHAAETVTYYHADAQGSVIAASDATGNLIWREAYQPYGERMLKPSTQNSSWYTGHAEDKDTSLSYMGARWYEPTLGRFMSVDPAGVDARNHHSFNRYAYANNNPYRYTDPNGESPVDLFFLAMDIGNLGMAIYNGEGVGSAAIDVGLSVLGVVSPVPGVGQGIKVARATDRAADGASAARGGRASEPVIDKATNQEVGRFIVDSKGNAMIEPVGGSTVAAGKGGVDTHTLYPNNSNYQRLNPQGHDKNPTPHAHGHLPGSGQGMKGQGESIDPQGNIVPWNSPNAHWPVN